MTVKAVPYDKKALYGETTQRTYSGRNLLQIAMPLGGIGAGCISLNGQGGLQDYSIRNNPATTAMPDGHLPQDAAFATLYFPKQGIARLVEGPMPVERIYDQGLKGQGYRGGGHEGLPRFRNASFKGEYPFGTVELSDPNLPLAVTITGFSPFIPLNDKDSSIPGLVLIYTIENTSQDVVPFEFGYHMSHFAYGATGWDYDKTRNSVIEGTGVYMYNVEDENSAQFGSCALGVIGHEPAIKAMWFRGGWFDSISALWSEVTTGSFTTNDGSKAETSKGRNGGSILLKGELQPGQKVTYPIVLTWYFPNVHYAYGELKETASDDINAYAEHGTNSCGPNCDCATKPPRWKPYYTSQWKDAKDVLVYVRDNYERLYKQTQRFHDALFRSTLPAYVLDAVSANLAIMKSPTVLRQANGNVWAWEGCFCSSGCCHGSCTHVWNYAQAFPHLFPALERTLREQELLRSIDDRGHVNFRAALPDGPVNHTFHAASDGQLGGIMKVYREWQISGDLDWLRELYPSVKQSMDYCIDCWDPDRTGVLSEPHHNTYDIEFWGPDGMCTSFYLGALAAMAALARAAGYPEDAAQYEELGKKGAQYLDEHLFNGEYYEQKVQLMGLRASPTEEELEKLKNSNPEEYALLMKEGPKYQYGTGCISDGVFGAWLAKLCGVETMQNRENIVKNLKAIFEYNFRESLWEHANPQRPGYAMGDEPGLLLCTWPKGGKPTLPFVYSDEVWTGIEYQVASHMIAEGLVDEGLTIVKALRSRYDGLVRNPWNEYECGNFYARAMASYALLIALSGFRYSAPEKTLYLKPQLETSPFEVFFSTATGWGTITIKGREVTVNIEEGKLEIKKLVLDLNGEVTTVETDVTATSSEKAVIAA
ncbi:MAG: hypothetical protein GX491_15490 [Chloroflexi bacterium]|nr:hypothetical protein [Chloroflexota bacterium]